MVSTGGRHLTVRRHLRIQLARARLQRLRDKYDSRGFWEGPDFSRAAKSLKCVRASAPEMSFSPPRRLFPQPLQPCR